MLYCFPRIFVVKREARLHKGRGVGIQKTLVGRQQGDCSSLSGIFMWKVHERQIWKEFEASLRIVLNARLWDLNLKSSNESF